MCDTLIMVMTQTVSISVRLSPELAEKLENIAKSNNIKVSELVREAIALLLDDSFTPEYVMKNWHIISIIVKNRPAMKIFFQNSLVIRGPGKSRRKAI